MSFQDELNRVTKTPEDVLSEREKEVMPIFKTWIKDCH